MDGPAINNPITEENIMGMQINTNIAALNAYRNLSNTQNDLSKSLEKLSSGLRINRAADDAAGLAISEGLRSQIGGLTVAARNAQDGVSVIQTAEGSLTEVHSILQRMRDLAVQAGNDSNSVKAREAITTEVSDLTEELQRISDSTNFNGIQLLDGTAGTLTFQVGADGNNASKIDVNMTTSNVSAIAGALTTGAGGTAFDALTPSDVTGALTFNLDGATSSVGVTLAGGYNTVQEIADALNADTGFTNGNLIASVNDTNQLVVTSTNGAVVDTDAPSADFGAGAASAAGILDFSNAAGARAAITAIDTQIEKVSTARAGLGAVQNRFESAINSLNVSRENISAAESRIRDTDMASEMVNFTRANLLSQAGTAMLAQANQSNSGGLQLLG